MLTLLIACGTPLAPPVTSTILPASRPVVLTLIPSLPSSILLAVDIRGFPVRCLTECAQQRRASRGEAGFLCGLLQPSQTIITDDRGAVHMAA